MVLNLISSSNHHFIMNYNINNIEKTLIDLHGMLKTMEASIAKAKSSMPWKTDIHVVGDGLSMYASSLRAN